MAQIRRLKQAKAWRSPLNIEPSDWYDFASPTGIDADLPRKNLTLKNLYR